MALLIAAVAVAALLGAAAARAAEPAADSTPADAATSDAVTATQRRPKLALLPMVVHSNEDPNYLRQGLSDMLTARFTKEALIEIIPIDDPRKATIDLDDALETARDAGAEYVVFGSFTRFGQGASLDVQAAAIAAGPDGETLREIFVHSGSIGAVIPDLDDLVGKITRFAIGEDVMPAKAAASGPAGSTNRKSGNDDLLRRLEALEDEVEALRRGDTKK